MGPAGLSTSRHTATTRCVCPAYTNGWSPRAQGLSPRPTAEEPKPAHAAFTALFAIVGAVVLAVAISETFALVVGGVAVVILVLAAARIYLWPRLISALEFVQPGALEVLKSALDVRGAEVELETEIDAAGGSETKSSEPTLSSKQSWRAGAGCGTRSSARASSVTPPGSTPKRRPRTSAAPRWNCRPRRSDGTPSLAFETSERVSVECYAPTTTIRSG